MLLDNPSLRILITENELPGILKAILKEKHWKKFNVASAKLVYIPHWFFNFDVYYETQSGVETYSSHMALDAVSGELNPIIIEIMKEIPTEQTKEIEKGEVEPVAISKDEAKDVAKIKLAGQMKIPKDKIIVSGLRIVYIPVYRTWVTLGKRIQLIDIDAISGSPINIKEVPEKQRGIIEITADTIEELKTPEGWKDYSKKTMDWLKEAADTTGGAIAKQLSPGGGIWSIFKWAFTTRAGQLTILTILILILFYLVLKRYNAI